MSNESIAQPTQPVSQDAGQATPSVEQSSQPVQQVNEQTQTTTQDNIQGQSGVQGENQGSQSTEQTPEARIRAAFNNALYGDLPDPGSNNGEGIQQTSNADNQQGNIQGTTQQDTTSGVQDRTVNNTQESNRDNSQINNLTQNLNFQKYTQDVSNFCRAKAEAATIEKYGTLEQNQITTTSLANQPDANGRITWKNPFDPQGEPLTDFTQVRQIVEAVNEQLKAEWNKHYEENENIWVQRMTPNVNMQAFTPMFQAESKEVQQVCAELIAPYAIKSTDPSNAGEIIGFNCDLKASLNTAKTIVDRLQKQNNQTNQQQVQQQQVEQPVTQPVLDINTQQGNSVNINQSTQPSQSVQEGFDKAMLKQLAEKINKRKENNEQ